MFTPVFYLSIFTINSIFRFQNRSPELPRDKQSYIYIFSAPKTILTDQGQNFISELITKFDEAFKIKHIKTTNFHPRSNGSLERTHTVVKDLIYTSLRDNDDKEWDEILNVICLGYNTALHVGTEFIPFELTFGRKANLPSAIAKTTTLTCNDMSFP